MPESENLTPQAMRRKDDCFATSLGVMLGVDALELPWCGDDDWEAAYQKTRAALAEMGWRLSWAEWPLDGTTLADLLSTIMLGVEDDPAEERFHWLISVSHPSWDGDAHVIVLRGGEIAFDPGGDVTRRPPLDELVVEGSFSLQPLEPWRMVLR